uniref:hypothetical protein n=1 Tax=Burkholderiales TaxID=80840 RepID=UPI00155DAD5F|nr:MULTISPECIES: hypothetical protein [Burkholderiales]
MPKVSYQAQPRTGTCGHHQPFNVDARKQPLGAFNPEATSGPLEALGKGTTVNQFLLRLDGVAGQDQFQQGSFAPEASREAILVVEVEDDADVRTYTLRSASRAEFLTSSITA